MHHTNSDEFNQQYKDIIADIQAVDTDISFHAIVWTSIVEIINDSMAMGHRGIPTNQLITYHLAVKSLNVEVNLDEVKPHIIIDWFLVYGVDHLMPYIVRKFYSVLETV